MKKLGWLFLIIAIAALAGAGYLYNETNKLSMQIDTLTADLNAASTAYASLEKANNEAQANLALMEEQITALTASGETLQADLDSANESLSAAESAAAAAKKDYEAKLTAADTQAATDAATITQLQEIIAADEATIAELTLQISTQEAAIAPVATQYAALQAANAAYDELAEISNFITRTVRKGEIDEQYNQAVADLLTALDTYFAE